MRIQIPGKTFIAGEYLVLKSGQALVFCSQPYFEVQVSALSGKEPYFTPVIHPESPAGKWLRERSSQNAANQNKIDFLDPYQGKGGYGASTAQFLGVHMALAKAKYVYSTQEVFAIRDDYSRLSAQGGGFPPSGADLIAQNFGGLLSVNLLQKSVRSLQWNFADLEFYIVTTGFKIPTHEHLNDLKDFDESEMSSAFEKILEGLIENHSEKFLSGVNGYALALKNANLVIENTERCLNLMKTEMPLLAAKGCGALGADTLFLVSEKKDKVFIEDYLVRNRWNWKNYSSKSEGVQILEGVQDI